MNEREFQRRVAVDIARRIAAGEAQSAPVYLQREHVATVDCDCGAKVARPESGPMRNVQCACGRFMLIHSVDAALFNARVDLITRNSRAWNAQAQARAVELIRQRGQA